MINWIPSFASTSHQLGGCRITMVPKLPLSVPFSRPFAILQARSFNLGNCMAQLLANMRNAFVLLWPLIYHHEHFCPTTQQPVSCSKRIHIYCVLCYCFKYTFVFAVSISINPQLVALLYLELDGKFDSLCIWRKIAGSSRITIPHTNTLAVNDIALPNLLLLGQFLVIGIAVA